MFSAAPVGQPHALVPADPQPPTSATPAPHTCTRNQLPLLPHLFMLGIHTLLQHPRAKKEPLFL